jgi:hypothetical protein
VPLKFAERSTAEESKGKQSGKNKADAGDDGETKAGFWGRLFGK